MHAMASAHAGFQVSGFRFRVSASPISSFGVRGVGSHEAAAEAGLAVLRDGDARHVAAPALPEQVQQVVARSILGGWVFAFKIRELEVELGLEAASPPEQVQRVVFR